MLETRIRTLSPEAVPWHYPLDKRGRVDERRAPGTRVIEHLYLNDKGSAFWSDGAGGRARFSPSTAFASTAASRVFDVPRTTARQ